MFQFEKMTRADARTYQEPVALLELGACDSGFMLSGDRTHSEVLTMSCSAGLKM